MLFLVNVGAVIVAVVGGVGVVVDAAFLFVVAIAAVSCC